MEPVISFYNSMFAWHEFVAQRQWTRLAVHMLKLSWKQHDLQTARFVCETMYMILRVFKKSLSESILAWRDKGRSKS
jgi:hypothetical protein